MLPLLIAANIQLTLSICDVPSPAGLPRVDGMLVGSAASGHGLSGSLSDSQGANSTAQSAEQAYRGNNFRQAAQQYSVLVGQTPSNGEFQFRLGHSYVEIGNYLESLPPLNEAIRRKVEVSRSHFFLARAYAGLTMPEASLDSLRDAAKAGFTDVESLRRARELRTVRDHPRFKELAEWIEFPAVKSKGGRLLDFLVGRWHFMTSGGTLAGVSVIRKMNKGFAVIDEWSSLDGSRASSTYSLDGKSGRWAQDWSNTSGWSSRREVKPISKGVELLGTTRYPDGTSLIERERITQVDPDTLRQLIHQSLDGGKSWIEVSDGLLVRVQPGSDL